MLNVKEVARLLDVSEKKIYRLIAQNEVPVYKIGEEYQFNRVELIEWATSRGITVSSDAYSMHASTGTAALRLGDAIRAGGIHYNVSGENKEAVLRNVVNVLSLPASVDLEFMYQVLIAREKLGSTGIGDGIAIPHVRNPVILTIDQPVVSLAFLSHPIEFESIDGIPVSILFTVISPTINLHLQLLSCLGSALQFQPFKEALRNQASPDVLLKALDDAEARNQQTPEATEEIK